jgi:hypothetical protein
VIEAFIDYVAHQPSDTTSPLYLELNTPSMLTAQGGPDKVRIYDANASEGNTPYCRLSDNGRRDRVQTFLGGSYIERSYLAAECVALGATALSATSRAELLELAVEGFVQALKADLSGLNTRLDLGGTGSSDRIMNIEIGTNTQEMPVQGQNGKFTASRTAIIELLVVKTRQR